MKRRISERMKSRLFKKAGICVCILGLLVGIITSCRASRTDPGQAADSRNCGFASDSGYTTGSGFEADSGFTSVG